MKIKCYLMNSVFILCLSSCCIHPILPPDDLKQAPKKIENTGIDDLTITTDQTKEAAKKAYVYAQIAYNVYSDTLTKVGEEKQFNLPANVVADLSTDEDDPRTGFHALTFNVFENGKISKKIVAYEGTTFSDWRDWVYGNLSLSQNRQGLAYYYRIHNKDTSIPIVVTGHSLGGAIALHVSMREQVQLYVFDSSYNYSVDCCKVMAKSDRNVIVWGGEILQLQRAPWGNPTALYTPIYCGKGMPITKHSMYKLAACLTQVAALTDTDAESSRIDNELITRLEAMKPFQPK